MKVAAIQMTSGPDVGQNLEQARALLEAAAARGAALAALPENFAFMGLKDADKRAVAESDGSGPIQDFLAATAQRLQLWIVGGTMPLRAGSDGRVAAASLVYDADGRRVARYDKIHLFDVDMPGRAETLPRVGARGARAASRRGRHAGGPARPHGVLRRALSRAVPAPERRGGADAHRALRVHRRPPGARTGRRCCGRGPSRTSAMSSRRRSRASTRTAARPTATA